MPTVLSWCLLIDYRLSLGSTAICSHKARDVGAPRPEGTRLQLIGSVVECPSQSKNPLEVLGFLSEYFSLGCRNALG